MKDRRGRGDRGDMSHRGDMRWEIYIDETGEIGVIGKIRDIGGQWWPHHSGPHNSTWSGVVYWGFTF